LEVEEIGHVSPAYGCFFKFGILKLKPPKKMMRDFGRISSQTSAKQLIAFLLLDHPKFGYLCWDMLGYPCLLSPSSLIFVVSFWICSGLSRHVSPPGGIPWGGPLGANPGEPTGPAMVQQEAHLASFSMWSYLGEKKTQKRSILGSTSLPRMNN